MTSNVAGASAPQSSTFKMKRIHILLTTQSVIIILLSVNRLGNLTTGYVAGNEFLRWVEFHNMLTLPLASLIAFYLLKKHLEYDSPEREGWRHRMISLLLVIGAYLLGAGYGDHEVTNYLHTRFCAADSTSDFCRIIIFNDDEFSHWVFFAGFTLITAAITLMQALFPYQGSLAARDYLPLIGNGLLIALGIFANLAFEEIGLDLYIVALLATLTMGLFVRLGARGQHQPILIYHGVAYGVGFVATLLFRGFTA